MAKTLRPILQTSATRPAKAIVLPDSRFWFDRVEVDGQILDIASISPERLTPFNSAVDHRWVTSGAPKIMGILNVTPDSFSDGGALATIESAVEKGLAMVAGGADILDIGGESTRPGAEVVPEEAEIARVLPVIEGLLSRNDQLLISVDTRKAAVAARAIDAGAKIVNDVSALRYDPEMLGVLASSNASICLMHSKETPKTMQADPRYQDVVDEVFQALGEARDRCIQAGIGASRIMIDPGLGFAKTGDHNLELTRNLSAFHGLGCAIVFGASRKRFIGKITGVETAAERVVGSVALALEAARQAVQIVRVHDIVATKQAFDMWTAATFREY